jgi:gliding motility-associated-like protein
MRRPSGIIGFLLALTLPVAHLQAQNLVPNPDFESYTICPIGYHTPGQNPPYPGAPWESTTWGSSDYCHSCSNPSDVGIPLNNEGWQYAHSGEAYAGLILKTTSVTDYREYLTAPLIAPLLGGKYYKVSFYVSLADTRCGLRQIGAYMSEERPPYVWGEFAPLDEYTPQVESNGGFLNDTMNWMLVEGCFRAEGGEAFITLGNFHDNANTPLDPACSNSIVAYYYLDDVYLGEVEPGGIDVDLGNDVTECYSAILNAGINGVDYYWSTGSTDASIEVEASGMYYLTVYDGCDAGVDSVEVFITDSPPVELPDDIIICPGESVNITLDPDDGDYVWNDGSTASEYSITTTGNFVVTLDDGCDITTDDIHVTVLPPPAPFSLGGDTLLCTGDVIEYYFDPDLGDFSWSNGSNSNSFNITGTGFYALTISNMCGEAEAEVIVDGITPEIVMLPLSADTLCNGASLAISLDSTAGTYLWQDGSTATEYNISTAGLYSVTLTHYCGPSADTILVTTFNAPLVNLGDTLTPCPGDTLTLSVTGIIGVYTWQDGSTNDSLSVTSSGTYALMIENACGIDSDQVVVLYEDILPVPDLGPDFSLCPGEQAILTPGNIAAAFLWQDASTADTLLVTSAGAYAVTISNACFSFSDTVVVDVESDPPTIVLPDQITLCQGITDTLNPGVSGVMYQWSDGSQNPTLIITAAGTYSLTVTNSCGTDIDTVRVLDGGMVPSVSLGADTSICPGTSFVLNPTFNAVDTWLWPDGSALSSYAVADSGQISVVVSNACGQDHDTIHVGLFEATPAPDLGADTSLCPGASVTLSVLYPNISIQWSDGSTGPNLVIDDPGTYAVAISNTCGLEVDTIVIDALAGIPILDLGPDLPLCPGEQLTLDPGIDDVAYLWQDGSVNTTYLANSAQTIILHISNACGTSQDTLIIYSSTNGPVVDLGPDIMECEGVLVTLESNISGVQYLWQDGTTGASFATTSSGTYYVQVSNACGMDSDTVVVDIDGTPPVPALGPDTMLCEGATLTLFANADAETTNVWQNGSTQPTFLVTNAGIYILTQTNRCGENADSIVVAFQPLPADIDLGPDTILCAGETLLLTAPATNDLLTWQDGSTGSTYIASQAGTYTLTMSNDCGSTSDQLLLTYDDVIPNISLDDTVTLCPGEQIILDVSQPFEASYAWSTGSLLPSITLTTPGIYAVTVSSSCQEVSTDITILGKNDCDGAFYIPNVISPNGDNINDVFTIFPNAEVNIIAIDGSIFDRWGNQVFHSSMIPWSWDGKAGDEDVNPGAFVYIMTVRYMVNGKEVEEKFAGDVTVVR